MAKRPEVKLTSPTTPPHARQPEVASTDVPAAGRTVAVGVGLKESEIHMLDEIARDSGIARNSLLRLAARLFLKQYRAGQIDLAQYVETETKRKLRMP